MEKELRAACQTHSQDHMAIHMSHVPSYHLPPEIVTVAEVEGC
jgi:hypothetical protein